MLLDAVGDRLRRKTLHGVMRLQSSQGRQRAQLFEIGAVLNEEVCEDGGWKLELKMAERDLQRFLKRENLADDLLEPLPVAQSATALNLK
jgi:GTP-binding protein HflX